MNTQACDSTAAHAAAGAAVAARPRLVLLTTMLASSLAFVDSSVINVGLPAIGRSLHASPDALQWVINAYLLPLSALLLLGGAAGDRYGRRLLLILGIGLFGVASLACALAPDNATLLAGRFLQGVGAAMLMPNSLAILGATFSGAAKGRAIGLWAAVGAATGAVGPVLGGTLIDLGSWRAIFLINLPLAAAAILLAWRSVPPGTAGGGNGLDAAGGVLATAGLGALTWALTVGSGAVGWTPGVKAAAVVAAGLLVAFVFAERRQGERAMMPLSLFGSRDFIGLSLLTLLLYGALGGMFVLFPYVLIRAGLYTATQAGAALVPLPLVIALVSPMMGGVAGRIGPRIPLIVGPLVMAGGFLLALRIGTPAHYWADVFPAILTIAVGLSGAVAPLTTAVLGSVAAERTGSASGLNSALARTGGLVATALLGSVLADGGGALVAAFHAALLVGAVVCLAACGCVFVLVRG